MPEQVAGREGSSCAQTGQVSPVAQVAGRRAETLAAALNGGKARSATDWRMFQYALKQSGAQEPAEVAQQLQRSLSASAAMRSDIEALLVRKKQAHAPSLLPQKHRQSTCH